MAWAATEALAVLVLGDVLVGGDVEPAEVDDGIDELVGVVLDDGMADEPDVVAVWLEVGVAFDEWGAGVTLAAPEKPQPAIRNNGNGVKRNPVALRIGSTSLNVKITPAKVKRLR